MLSRCLVNIARSGIRPVMSYSTFTPAPPLKPADLNQHVIEAQYAVRGAIPIRADELQSLIDANPDLHGLPFPNIINANIGNPQQLGQKPLTWYRQVLLILQHPQLLKTSLDFPKDVIQRARELLHHSRSLGAYSHSQGVPYIRKSVADFIAKRDGYPSSPDSIFLTSGASASVSYLLQLLSSGPNSGFLIPIPQYPLYTASIALNNAKPIGYHLDEDNGWSTDPAQIRKLIKENHDQGVDIKALVVINPGNPTGSTLEKHDMVELINIAAEHGILIISDEVYQENVFEGQFISMKKVLSELKQSNADLYSSVQLASLHSISKGVSGECGQRGGYMELVGFTPEVQALLFKLASINLCSVVSGQCIVELMVNPPTEGDESYELYKKETSAITQDLQTRAHALHGAFEAMQDVTCDKPKGAMYLFPRLNFTPEKYPKLFEKASELEKQVDDIYCIDLLENTGICCIPGNGFGQVEGTYHLRTTFLAPGTEWVDRWTKFHKEFVEKYSN